MKKSLLPSPTFTSSTLSCLTSISHHHPPSLNPTSIRWPKRQQSGRLSMPFRGITSLPIPESDPAYDDEEEESRNIDKVEELEMLEAAAIAGQDQGRAPTDYDRRAHIFSESSRVFQELKDKDANNDHLEGDNNKM